MFGQAGRLMITIALFLVFGVSIAQNAAHHPKPSEQSAPNSSDQPNPTALINSGGKRRQYVPSMPPSPLPVSSGPGGYGPPPSPELMAPAPGPVPTASAGQCPGGPSLPVECDPKRPWPQCPPQSYCYATNSVDIGPYFCCPVWSTYGAAWRPATPFSDYVPPVAPNWGPRPPAAAPPQFPYPQQA